MKITVLDRASMGYDTPFDALYKIGDVEIFDTTSSKELHNRIKKSDVIVLNKIRITEKIIASAKSLKLICVFATGYDNIDVAAAKKYGIAVCNVPGYSTDSVTLFTVSTVLSLAMHMSEYNEYVKNGSYMSSGIPNLLTPVYHEIRGKVWGIVGYGNIGKSVARVAKALGAKVIVNKRTPIKEDKCVDIDTLCRESDIITLHCPLTTETTGLISLERLSMMKRNVILVNEARGAIVDENAVAEAVLNNKIAAYGCDVYSSEPFDEHHPYTKIMGMKNVILTPHAAWAAFEARRRCVETIANNIRSHFFENNTLNRVDLI